MPVSRSAPPIASAKMPTRSAKNEVFSAVVSAVSVTHKFRAWFLHRLARRVLGGQRLVVCRLAVRVKEAPHLGVHLTAARLEGVDPHVAGERLSLGSGIDGLACNGMVGDV